MSAYQTTRRLVRLYPHAWRERYGDELEALILESCAGGPVTLRTRVNVTLSAVREHARRLAPGHGAAPERSRMGMMLALWAWMLFVCAGASVQRASEHWQGSVPSSARDLPAAAFDALLAGATAGGVLVLVGFAVLLPSAWSLWRTRQGREIRAAVVRSAAATLLAFVAGVAVVVWARHLTSSQRNGGDVAYAAAFVAFALLVALCLASWTATAGALVRRWSSPHASSAPRRRSRAPSPARCSPRRPPPCSGGARSRAPRPRSSPRSSKERPRPLGRRCSWGPRSPP